MKTSKFQTNKIIETPQAMAHWLQTNTEAEFEVKRQMGSVEVKTDATDHDQLMDRMYRELKRKDPSLDRV